MKRKPRQRLLPIDMAVILHPVTYERGKELFATLKNRLASKAETHDTPNQRA